MKRRRLKKWVRVTLTSMAVILFGGLFYLVIAQGSKNINDMYEQCDNAKGYTCSYYEARQYMLRGE